MRSPPTEGRPARATAYDWHLHRAAQVLQQGGLVAYPTEAVWGLGCDPLNPEAVFDLLALKGRSPDKGLILIAADYEQLLPYIAAPAALEAQVRATWPGPVTWLLPARPEVPVWLRGAHTRLAVRVTAHPRAAALCTAYGAALVSTSANPAGRPPARSRLAVQRMFGRQLDYILPGELGGQSAPTEIREAGTGRIVRPG